MSTTEGIRRQNVREKPTAAGLRGVRKRGEGLPAKKFPPFDRAGIFCLM